MKSILALLFVLAGFGLAHAEKNIGSVSTNFRLLGPNDKVVVERFDDPQIANVSCYASFAQTGGISGGLGVATDPSQFALNCVAHGPVTIPADLPKQAQMGAISASFLFKHFIITRMVDRQDNTLVYVLISTKILHGSPANAVSAVPASN
ncbi:MAG TPA: CreA family protein [Acidocella sp.]|nr:CreA family protein [Acidocella sp.]